MKLLFSWADEAGRLTPSAICDAVNSDGVSALACLLTDDGGLGHSESIAWLDEGLARIDRVLKGEAATLSWDREDWGAELRHDFVSVHSLHDDSYAQRIESAKFRAVLLSWRDFLRATAKAGATRELVV